MNNHASGREKRAKRCINMKDSSSGEGRKAIGEELSALLGREANRGGYRCAGRWRPVPSPGSRDRHLFGGLPDACWRSAAVGGSMAKGYENGPDGDGCPRGVRPGATLSRIKPFALSICVRPGVQECPFFPPSAPPGETRGAVARINNHFVTLSQPGQGCPGKIVFLLLLSYICVDVCRPLWRQGRAGV